MLRLVQIATACRVREAEATSRKGHEPATANSSSVRESFRMHSRLIARYGGLVWIGADRAGACVTARASDDGVRHGSQMGVDPAKAIQEIKEAWVRLLTGRQPL